MFIIIKNKISQFELRVRFTYNILINIKNKFLYWINLVNLASTVNIRRYAKKSEINEDNLDKNF